MGNLNPNTIGLKPFKKGQSGNPKGALARKGRPTLKTIIKNMLEGEELDWKKVPIKNNGDLEEKYGKNGWIALVYVALGKAMSGDIRAMDWLRKAQYGDKINLVDEDGNSAPIFVYDFNPPVQKPKPKPKAKPRKAKDAPGRKKGGDKPKANPTPRSGKK